jgi:hypothetical protein
LKREERFGDRRTRRVPNDEQRKQKNGAVRHEGRDDRAAHPLMRLLEQKRNVLSARFLDAQVHMTG